MRLVCLPHTLKLVAKEINKSKGVFNLNAKTRSIVRKIKTSSTAVSSSIQKAGKGLIKDNSTRWNSTNLMLLELKPYIREC